MKLKLRYFAKRHLISAWSVAVISAIWPNSSEATPLPFSDGRYVVDQRLCDLTEDALVERYQDQVGGMLRIIKGRELSNGYEMSCRIDRVTMDGTDVRFDALCETEGGSKEVRATYRALSSTSFAIGSRRFTLCEKSAAGPSVPPISDAQASKASTLPYGSRAGMEVEIVSASGLDSEHAVIRIRRSPESARAFCRDYAHDQSESCVEDQLAMPLSDMVRANWQRGEFSDLHGHRYKFAGKNAKSTSTAKYRLIDLASGVEADGTTASGYSTNLAIFRALCPTLAPRDE